MKIRTLPWVLFVGTLAVANPGFAAGNAAAGEKKAQVCASCHGAAGNETTTPAYPILAGQYADYLVKSLEGYRSGARENAIMQGFAAQLSDEDIADLAAWFASQPSGLTTAPRP